MSATKETNETKTSDEAGEVEKQPGPVRTYWQAFLRLPWRRWLRFSWVIPSLENLTNVVLKLGTLLLVGFFLVFFVRLFQDQGYVIQSISVPTQLLNQGYTGQVVALRIQDQVVELKELAGSVKADSLQLKGNQQDLDLSVLGVGLSLRGLAFQLREALGRENKTVTGEITRIGDQYRAQVRMTGYDRIDVSVKVEKEAEAEALDRVFRLVAEGVLYETDPYRLALVQRKEERYDEAVSTIRHYLQDRESEAHWAYLCWGSLLRELGKEEAAVAKLERAIAIKPDFSLPYINVAWAYDALDRPEDAIKALKQVVKLEPDNVWRRSSLAWAYYNNGMLEQADSVFEHTLATMDLNPDTRADFAIGWAEQKLQNDEISEAKRIIDTYVEAYREDVFSYLVKGISAFAEQDTTQALVYLKSAFDLDPSDVGAIQSNIGFNLLMKNHETAIDFYQAADFTYFSAENEIQVYNQIAMAFNLVEKHDSAFATVYKALSVDPQVDYPYTTLAETFYFTGQKDSCMYYLKKALDMGFNPESFSLEEPPYNVLRETLEFQQLLARYQKKEVVLRD